MYDIIIIGAGPAGLTAGLYAIRAGKKTLIIEGESFGGQIIISPEVENYPFVKKISGSALATTLVEQLMELGAELEMDNVLGITVTDSTMTVKGESADYTGKCVIIATGAKARTLGLTGEAELVGRGVSYCALCDGAFFKGKTVAVVGGGSAALEEAIFLSGYCSKVYLIHRRDSFRAEPTLQKAVLANEKIVPVYDNVTEKLLSTEEGLRALEIRNVKTGAKQVIGLACVFVSIGRVPNNAGFAPLIKLDESGYVIAGEDCTTNVDGIFVAGDCRTKEVRQLTTATADGTMAAVKACKWLTNK